MQAARDALLQSRSDRLDGCAARIHATFDRLPWPENQHRTDALFERIIGADEVYAITSVGAMPTEADEATRLTRLLREAGVR